MQQADAKSLSFSQGICIAEYVEVCLAPLLDMCHHVVDLFLPVSTMCTALHSIRFQRFMTQK